MSKVVNIDEFLNEKEMKFVIKGKEYIVKDIPLEAEDALKDGVKGMRKALASMFGCGVEELEGLGQGACIKIWEEVNRNFLPVPDSEKDQ